MITSLLIAFLVAPYFIKALKRMQPTGQPIRSDGPSGHITSKSGTPTMGGLIILFSVILSSVLWVNLFNPYIWIVLFVMISLGILGFMDDYLKVTRNNHNGVSPKLKMIAQGIISVVACLAIQKYSISDYKTSVALPFFKNMILDLGHFYFIFVFVVIVGASNAVNLTDGLDGLATVPIALVAGCFAVICYLVGNYVFSTYLQINYIPGIGELTVFCSALIGSCLGFLWYNAHPSKIFMGDTGSLSLGGALGVISVASKHEFALAIAGGLFVLEAISVIIQVLYFKFTGGKRFFFMAPVHHHFEKKGWTESEVVIRFWIIAVVFALLSLATLKLR